MEYKLDRTYKFRSLSLFDENSEPLDISVQEETVYGYMFEFRNSVDGFKILGNDVVRIEVVDGKPSMVHANMNQYQTSGETKSHGVNSTAAIKSFGKYVDAFMDGEADILVINIGLSYRDWQDKNELLPVWAVEYQVRHNEKDYDILRFEVNALTGEPLIEIPEAPTVVSVQEADEQGMEE